MMTMKLSIPNKAASIAFLFLYFLVGCDTHHPPGAFILVFVDSSVSAWSQRADYKAEIHKIAKSLGSGEDQMVVNWISYKTFTDAKPLFESPLFPVMGAFDNPLIFQKRQDKLQTVLTEKLHAVDEAIEKAAGSPATDIVNAFSVASTIFPPEKQKKLVFLCDMLQNSEIAGTYYNFETDTLKPTYRANLLKTLKTQGLVPDLAGVEVYVGGAKSADRDTSDTRALAVKCFWEEYIALTGATLKEYGAYLYHFTPEPQREEHPRFHQKRKS